MGVGNWEMGFEGWRFARAHWVLWWIDWVRLLMGRLERPLRWPYGETIIPEELN
jgi:hypothetical protein